MSLKIAILASGKGTNAENIIRHVREYHSYDLEVSLVICNERGAAVLSKAKKYGVPTILLPHQDYPSREEHEKAILRPLKELNISWICLAGYMKILSPQFLENFRHSTQKFYKILNIHPSLLPLYPGKGSYEKAFADGVEKSGVTVHLVDEEMDSGPIILQESFEKKAGDTLETFINRGKSIEAKLYPMALDFIIAHRN